MSDRPPSFQALRPEVVAVARDGTARIAEPLPQLPDFAPGSLVAIAVAHPAQLAAGYAALLEAGAVPLVLPSDRGSSALRTLARSCRAAALIHGDPPQIDLLGGTPVRLPEPGHLLATSGTTGRGNGSKIFYLPLDAAVANARAHLASLDLTLGAGTPTLLTMPLAHSFGLVAGLLGAGLLGGPLYAFEETPDPATLLSVLAREEIELVYLAPPLARLILRRMGRRAPPSLPALRAFSVGSAAMARRELRALLGSFPEARGYFTYGLTELGPRVSTFSAGTHASPAAVLDDAPARPVPVGAPLSGVTMTIDEDAALWVESPFAHSHRLVDGGLQPRLPGPWRTGDAARRGTDGSIELLGRTDGTVVRGGTNVYADDVELVALADPGVRAACLVGRPSRIYGAVPVLYCETRADADPERLRAGLFERLAAELPPVAVPVALELVAEGALPRTESGKIRRGALVAREGGAHGD